MEILIEKLEIISTMLELLEDGEKFEGLNEKLKKINDTIEEIFHGMNELNYSEKKYKKIMEKKEREEILTKSLFPYYWLLSQKVNNVDEILP